MSKFPEFWLSMPTRDWQEGADLKELLAAADQYDLPELKERCAQGLVATGLTMDNYSELLRLAELHNAPALKAAVLKYIAINVNRLSA
jgi:hypothetical protein